MMRNKTNQLPQGIIGFAYLRDRSGSIAGIRNSELNYSIIFRPNGHPPRSGILLCHSLNSIPLKNARILDVGTGESAILAIHAVRLGAKEAIGIDIDPVAIRWAHKNIGANSLSERISLQRIAISNYKPNLPFDVIIGNPPQMPSKESKSIHDDGGKDGRKYIYQIIDFSTKFLRSGGKLIFTAFDFLGVDVAYDDAETIFDFLKRKDFGCKLVAVSQKFVRKGSYTDRCLPWISKQYPNYVFRKGRSGFKMHKVCVILAENLSSTA